MNQRPKWNTLLISINATEYGQDLALALFIKVLRINTASIVLLSFLKPNCSGPNIPCFSAMSIIFLFILLVISLRMLMGTVMGRYWTGCRESPPYSMLLQNYFCQFAKLSSVYSPIGDWSNLIPYRSNTPSPPIKQILDGLKIPHLIVYHL